MKKRPKRGVSAIIATVLLVLLVITAVLIVWLIIKQEMQKQEKEIRAEPYSISLSIVAFSYNETSDTAWISIRRGNDKARLAGIRFVLENSEKGESCSEEITENLPEPLETKTLAVDTSCMPDFNILSIYPMLLIGTEIKIGPKQDEIHRKTGAGGGSSWRSSGGAAVPDVPPEARPPLVVYIDSCQELNRSGVVYKLTDDILDAETEACMNITANNITLDCQGHVIKAAEDSNARYGILASSVSSISIRNCGVEGYQGAEILFYKFGVYLQNTHNSFIENVNASFNNLGISLFNSKNNLLSNNRAKNNYFGFNFLNSSFNIVSNNIAKDNSVYDLSIMPTTEVHCSNQILNMTGSGDLPIKFFNYSVTM